MSWDNEAKRTKAEATIPLVPGRNEDLVSQDDLDLEFVRHVVYWNYFETCQICVYFGIKYLSVIFVMTAFPHIILH